MSLKTFLFQAMGRINHHWKLLRGKKEKNTLYQSVRTFDTAKLAQQHWPQAVARLLNVNAWSQLDSLTANFQVYDLTGYPQNRDTLKPGDYIRIELPGPTPVYWVQVTELYIEPSQAGFTATPTAAPERLSHEAGKAKPNAAVTDHFFEPTARSVFRLQCIGNQLTAMQIGLNEKINNSPDQAGGKGMMNTLVAEGGWLGFQKHQWDKVTDYIVSGTS